MPSHLSSPTSLHPRLISEWIQTPWFPPDAPTPTATYLVLSIRPCCLLCQRMETIRASQLSYSSSPSISFLPTGSFCSACKNTPISSGRRHLLLPLLTQMNLPMPSLLRSLSFYSPLNLLVCFVLSFLRRYFLKVTPCQANRRSQWYYSDSSGGKIVSYFLYCAFLCFPNFYNEFTQVRKLKKFF